MLDIKFIRENKDIVQAGATKKHIDIDIGKLVTLDDERLKELKEVEDLRAEVNRVSNDIGRNQDSALKIQLIEEMRTVKEDIKAKEEKLKSVISEWQSMMVQVPNVPDMSVPEGNDDKDNQEVKVWGEVPKFEFAPKDHIELMTSLGMLDIERGTKVSGFRGYFLKGDGVRLQFALWQFVQDFFQSKNTGNWVPLMAPALVNREVLLGTGYIPQGEDDLYKTQDGNFLSGTAEAALMSYYAGEILEKKDLPIRMLGFANSFRREIGSHGKDTRGILRVHEFYKFEQVVLCEAKHEDSVKFHEEVNANGEEIMQALGLPYHLVVNCGGDLGLGQVKKYDLEAWLPSENAYRETHSASYFHDFQTRRLNIRYRDEDGKLKFVHSLNNTALSGRPLIMIVENYQQADGSIKIPEVLRKYMGGREFITK